MGAHEPEVAAAGTAVRSFEPVSSANARLLILGSMPGERSLAAAQYYAHPRNAFWKIMQEVVGLDAQTTYEKRIRALQDRSIALWDVIHSCHRRGSLDAAIRRGSVQVNDFNAFFRRHPGIATVLLNGAAAEHYYERYVLPGLERQAIEHLRMPSTSPAHAAMPLRQKIEAWRAGIEPART